MFSGKKLLVGAAVSAIGMATSTGTALAVPWHQIQNAGTGLCLSSYPDQNGHIATQQRCDGSANQMWVQTPNGPGSDLENEGMSIAVNYFGGSDLGCLRNQNDTVANNNPLIMRPCHQNYSSAIEWSQGGTSVSNNAFLLHGGDNFDFCASSLGNGTVGSGVYLYTCSKTSTGQAWYGPLSVYGDTVGGGSSGGS